MRYRLWTRLLTLSVIFIFFQGCARFETNRQPTPTPVAVYSPGPTSPDNKNTGITTGASQLFVPVTVFYATDRNLQADHNPEERYGANRGNLTLGTCEVSIPKSHETGQLERPNFWKLDFREDPKKHVTLRGLTMMDNAVFFTNLKAEIKTTTRQNAFIFIHGYNVSFADAALRTGQMAYDFGYHTENKIVPVFYSWPSQGHTPSYIMDEDNVEWAQFDLKNFLEDFANHSTAKHIYLIAHSMGNRALTRAFVELIMEKPELKERFQEIILAAPDMDAEVFKREIAPKIVQANVQVTLYTSEKDKALAASKLIHGYLRAGETGQGMVVMPGIETIDATRVTSEDWLLGHSYYGSFGILNDMESLILDGKRAGQRFSIRPSQSGGYFEFQ
jgi:esterase/lipase superfamily enzyme